MSYADFWDGDVEIARYYRECERQKRKEKNMWLWIQGRYMYEAFIATFPVFNPFSKLKEPLPYLSAPIPLSDEEAKERKEEIAKKKYEKDKQMFVARVAAMNAKLSLKEGEE